MTDSKGYIDTKPGVITKKDLNKVALRTMLINASFNYERMQAIGFTYSLLPVINKVHTLSLIHI